MKAIPILRMIKDRKNINLVISQIDAIDDFIDIVIKEAFNNGHVKEINFKEPFEEWGFLITGNADKRIFYDRIKELDYFYTKDGENWNLTLNGIKICKFYDGHLMKRAYDISEELSRKQEIEKSKIKADKAAFASYYSVYANLLVSLATLVTCIITCNERKEPLKEKTEIKFDISSLDTLKSKQDSLIKMLRKSSK